MGRAYFDVSPQLIIDALKIPEGTQLYGAEWSFAVDCLRLYVMSPDLPDTLAGACPIRVVPTITESDGGSIKWDWNGNGIGA